MFTTYCQHQIIVVCYTWHWSICKETVRPALWCRKHLQSREAMCQWVHIIRTQQVEKSKSMLSHENFENKVLWAHFWGPFWSRILFHQSYLYISALTHAKMKGHGPRPVVVTLWTMMASLPPSIIMVMTSSMCLHLENFPRLVSMCHDSGS